MKITIKKFFLIVFFSLFALAVYLHWQYSIAEDVELTTKPITSYSISEIRCASRPKRSNHLVILFAGKKYNVDISDGVCSDIESGKLLPKFYYIKATDELFYQNQYIPFPYVYFTYIASVLIPILGFIIYRKELDNHYSTM